MKVPPWNGVKADGKVRWIPHSRVGDFGSCCVAQFIFYFSFSYQFLLLYYFIY